MSWIGRKVGAVLGRLPQNKALKQRRIELQLSLEAANQRVADLQQHMLFFGQDREKLQDQVAVLEARNQELYEKWIDFLTHRQVFGAQPESLPAEPPVKVPVRQFANRLAARKNRKFLRDLMNRE